MATAIRQFCLKGRLGEPPPVIDFIAQDIVVLKIYSFVLRLLCFFFSSYFSSAISIICAIATAYIYKPTKGGAGKDFNFIFLVFCVSVKYLYLSLDVCGAVLRVCM